MTDYEKLKLKFEKLEFWVMCLDDGTESILETGDIKVSQTKEEILEEMKGEEYEKPLQSV